MKRRPRESVMSGETLDTLHQDFSKEHESSSVEVRPDQVDNVTYQTLRGVLYITNRRIIFQGEQEGFDLKVDDLIAITPYSNCVELQTSKAHYKIFVPNGNVAHTVLRLIR